MLRQWILIKKMHHSSPQRIQVSRWTIGARYLQEKIARATQS
jgi:hypothetical protein